MDPEPILDVRQEYTLDETPVRRRASCARTHTFTPGGNLGMLVCFCVVGGNQNVVKEQEKFQILGKAHICLCVRLYIYIYIK